MTNLQKQSPTIVGGLPGVDMAAVRWWCVCGGNGHR